MHATSRQAAGASPGEVARLDSWKEIAAYLDRHVTTVRRWERLEGLPVHRHRHAALASVYAFSNEIDAWLRSRGPLTRSGAAPRAAVDPSAGECLPPSPLLTVYGSTSVPLVGREAEWQVLASGWDAARAGPRRLVLITGEPGAGKTRLVFEFARTVSATATVLVGRCDREGLVPFAPFVEMLQWIVQACPAEALRAYLGGSDGSRELAELVPEIAHRAGARERSAPSTPEGRRYRMFEAYGSLLRSLSVRAPVLLVIEDLHWADRGSLLLWRHLARGVHDARLCLLVTCCEAEAASNPWLAGIVAECRVEPSASSIALRGLSSDAVQKFVAHWTGRSPSPALVRFVSGRTQGNPLFISEVLRHLSETDTLARIERGADVHAPGFGVPEGVHDLVRRRLARLTEHARKLLTLAAVSGREFDVSTIEAMADLPEGDVLAGIDEALAAHLVREVPHRVGRFAFAHALIAEALYEQLPAARRARLHHRMAEAMERQPHAAGAPLAELAHHFCRAASFRDARKAVDYAVRAAEHAEAGLALEDAARLYGMALEALEFAGETAGATQERFALHERRGRSFFQAGGWQAAREELDKALDLLDPGDDLARCPLLVRLAEAAFWLMDVPALRRYASEGERLAGRIGRQDLWADARAWSSSADVADGDVLGAVASDRQTVARAGGIRSFGLARIPLTLYWAGQTDEALERSEEAVTRARAADDPAFLLYALQHRGLCLSGAGRYDEAIRTFDEARAFGRSCGALPLLARATSMSVAPVMSLGDFEGATLRALEARELAHRVAFEAPIVSAGIDLLVIGARTNDPERSEALLPEITEAVERASGWHAWKWRMRLCQARAELALARGDPGEAVIAAGQVVEQSRLRNRPKYEALALWARARARAGTETKKAAQDARAAANVARTVGDPALLFDCLSLLLALDGSDALLAEVRETARRILAALHTEPLRSRFLSRAAAMTGASPGIAFRVNG